MAGLGGAAEQRPQVWESNPQLRAGSKSAISGDVLLVLMAVGSNTPSRVNAEMHGGIRAELGELVGLGGDACIVK